ncbi:phenylalanyl-tRNA synthetase beta chain [Pancytospora epiphaga]|nr:phenylalanyl-tRNA synthetase beta chain [Pancytospora epiphaga]
MPSLSVEKDLLLNSVGCSEIELEKRVFDFGVELDDVYEEDGKTMYKFDIAANRYDLLCLEGLVTALRSFMNGTRYLNIQPSSPKITVVKAPTNERQHIACGVIRNLKLSKETYDSIIAYQDKLHLSIGRNRSVVAIGTHDLDKIGSKIEYKQVKLRDIDFIPLGGNSPVNGADLETYFEDDKKISKYFGLLAQRDSSVVFCSDGAVMSLPPIINSATTRLTLDTKNVFIEVTGTDFEKVNTTLKLLLYNFRGEEVESVKIQQSGDFNEKHTLVTPVFYNRKYTIEVDTINKKLNLSLSAEDIKILLERMMYYVEIKDELLIVQCIDVRSDILHLCDIVEDVAIAYGFNNFVKRVPGMYTPGAENPLNKFSDKIRGEFALAGFLETLTLTLLSKAENFIRSDKQVVLSNPKSREYEVVRTSLLPGLLKALGSNLHARIPVRIFEVSDVVLLDAEVPEGAKNLRMLCGCVASNSSMLEELQGPLSLLFEKCGIRNYEYHLFEDTSKYLPNQSAVIKIGDEIVGDIGVLHPKVCTNFRIPYAASVFEVNIEILFKHFAKK